MDFQRPLSVVAPTLDGDVLAVLAGAKEEFTGRRIHRVLDRGSEQGVRKAADRLVEQGVVIRRQAGQAKLYGLNRDHLAAPYIEGLGALRAELVERLRETVAAWEMPPSVVLLFGSVARGEAGAESDLDLLVLRRRDTDQDDPDWQEQLLRLEREATAWTGNETKLIEYSKDDLEDPAVHEVAEEALEDGISIFGGRIRLRRLLKSAKENS
jgi:predicted nucleotidyltransferase